MFSLEWTIALVDEGANAVVVNEFERRIKNVVMIVGLLMGKKVIFKI